MTMAGRRGRMSAYGVAGRALLVLALAASPAVAAVATGGSAVGPMATARRVLTASNGIVTGAGTRDAKLEQLKELLRDFLDTDALGRQSMGSHLDGETPAEQRRFLDLFRHLFVRTYVQRLLLFEVPDFAYGGERIEGDRAEIETEIVSERDRFAVDYVLLRTNGQWRAADILIEDVSLAANFRAQFDAALARDSFDGLLDKLERKVSPPAKEAGGAP